LFREEEETDLVGVHAARHLHHQQTQRVANRRQRLRRRKTTVGGLNPMKFEEIPLKSPQNSSLRSDLVPLGDALLRQGLDGGHPLGAGLAAVGDVVTAPAGGARRRRTGAAPRRSIQRVGRLRRRLLGSLLDLQLFGYRITSFSEK